MFCPAFSRRGSSLKTVFYASVRFRRYAESPGAVLTVRTCRGKIILL